VTIPRRLVPLVVVVASVVGIVVGLQLYAWLSGG
jgi:hypothetical protein